MIRLFTAIELPDDVRAALANMAGGIPGARWVPEENLHLTLRFIGEVTPERADELAAVLAGVEAPAFNLTLQGTDCFSKGKKPGAVWAGVVANDTLHLLRDRIESALVQAGEEPDKRRYTPHVTLARLKEAPRNRVQQFLSEHNLFRAGPFPVTEFALYSSHLGKNGPDYQVEMRFPLRGAPPAPGDDDGAP